MTMIGVSLLCGLELCTNGRLCLFTQEINAHASFLLTAPSGDDSTAATREEFVHITVEFVELTSKSSKVAQALCRLDESAYRAACRRTHALLSKKRRNPVRVPMKPGCLAIMQFGRGMKLQVGGGRWKLNRLKCSSVKHTSP